MTVQEVLFDNQPPREIAKMFGKAAITLVVSLGVATLLSL